MTADERRRAYAHAAYVEFVLLDSMEALDFVGDETMSTEMDLVRKVIRGRAEAARSRWLQWRQPGDDS